MSLERKERLDEKMVFEFVKVSHGGFDRVKELLESEPGLVNACWNWGGDDWETALGAAAHTGQKAIAEFLLAHGARMDLFCAAMLGKKEIVQSYIDDNSQVVHVKGPHGIPLIAHAQAGGQEEIAALIEHYL